MINYLYGKASSGVFGWFCHEASCLCTINCFSCHEVQHIEIFLLLFQASYVLPSNFEDAATGVLKVLNNLALLDIMFLQRMLVSYFPCVAFCFCDTDFSNFALVVVHFHL